MCNSIINNQQLLTNILTTGTGEVTAVVLIHYTALAYNFDKASFVKVCGFNEIDTIVTEEKPSEIWLERLKQNNVKVVYEEN